MSKDPYQLLTDSMINAARGERGPDNVVCLDKFRRAVRRYLSRVEDDKASAQRAAEEDSVMEAP